MSNDSIILGALLADKPKGITREQKLEWFWCLVNGRVITADDSPMIHAVASLIEAPSKCDSCPFGSMLKEYEEDESTGPGPTVEPGPCKSTAEGSTPSPGSTIKQDLTVADMGIERALLELENAVDWERKHDNRPHAIEIFGRRRAALAVVRATLSDKLSREKTDIRVSPEWVALLGFHLAAHDWAPVVKMFAEKGVTVEEAKP